MLALRPEEKMVLAERGWMHIVVPYPAWAMKESEIAHLVPVAESPADTNGSAFALNLPED